MRLKHATQRLELQVLSAEQAPAVLDFYQRNRSFLEPYEPARQKNFYTLDFQQRNLVYEYNAFLKFSYLRFWLFLKGQPRETIGSVCFSNFLKGSFCSCMLGYKLDRNYCGEGFMQEALTYLLPLVAQEYRFHRIEAYVMPSNAPSIHLLQKLHFQEEGLLREYAWIYDRWQDHLLYSLLFPSNGYSQ